LAARPEEDEGGRGPVVRERRGGGRWACGSGSGKVGWVAWAGWQAKAEGVGGPAGKEKKKEIHSKLISRFRKMNKVFQVTEIIGKNPINS
jgi:hypothetical protein